MPLFTVGHGTRSVEELVEVLAGAGVERLVDIRRFPGSRRSPHLPGNAQPHRVSEFVRADEEGRPVYDLGCDLGML